uniref:WD repeat-containing protein 11-like n=1 Tax=Nicotiana tabacum TaxID=4097 RepID=A0A1S3XFX5_TOBAC
EIPPVPETSEAIEPISFIALFRNNRTFKGIKNEDFHLWQLTSDLSKELIRLVSIGNLEAAVSLLLSTPPESSYFYANALRAVALSSAVSTSLLELAVKVVAANMVRTDRSLSGTHLLCAVGRYQEACSQVVIAIYSLFLVILMLP